MVDVNVDNGNEQSSIPVIERRKYHKPIPDELPVLPLRNAVIFPYTVLSISVGQARSICLLDDLSIEQPLIAIVASKDPKQDQPDTNQIFNVGCVAQVLRLNKNTEDGSVDLLLQGLDKIKIDSWISEKPYLRARISKATDIEPAAGNIEAEALRNNLVELFQKLVAMIPYLPEKVVESVSQTRDYRHFTYLISSSVRLDIKDAQIILEQEDVLEKMRKLTENLNHEIEVFELGKKIQSQARTEMEKSQRDYVLRQQLKAIRKELGDEGDSQVRIEEYQRKIEGAGLSEEAKIKANEELLRLERIPEVSSEYGVILTYLDWLTALPWQISTPDDFDVTRAKTILDEDHFGLEKIKERILEYIAVRQLRLQRFNQLNQHEGKSEHQVKRHREGVILCLAGPPGIGKTSLGYSIARALGRKLQRISLGGVRDEAEIRGHRRTYMGAMPGRFISALRDVGTNNPIILLDEVDKLGADWRGDPSSALLEVLDPEQNKDFRDHYLDVAFDLSQLMFIATANVAENIPGPLLDRMETLTIPGYTDEEKLHIAENYLLPRQKLENALHDDELKLSEASMLKLIREYTREAGVRNLDRRLGAICRKAVVKIAEKKQSIFNIDENGLESLLGKPVFHYDIAERTKIPGVVTGLAVTAVGGDILFVEATSMPGKKGLTITGQVGDVMHESVETAVSYVRSHAELFKIDNNFFEKRDLHVHLPAGAIPKDGPSAGVAMVIALVSLLTETPVCMSVGVTGEITLRGLVLPVGGIKDKVLAAHRANLTTVILPKKNEKDLDDLPDSVKSAINFVLVNTVEDAIAVALKR